MPNNELSYTVTQNPNLSLSLFSEVESRTLTNNLRWEPVSNTTNNETVNLADERQEEVDYYASIDKVF